MGSEMCIRDRSQVANKCRQCAQPKVGGICEVCDKPVSYSPSRPRKTCGRKCADTLRARNSSNSQSRKIETQCANCGRCRFVSPVYGARKYCSPRCAYDAQTSHHEVTSEQRKQFYHLAEWKRLRRDIWARERGKCQRCGDVHRRPSPPFHVHHIASWTRYPDVRLDSGNLALLLSLIHI